MTYITLTAADGHLCQAYLASPSGTPRAHLVLLQEIFGVNAHIRDVADRYAAAGYRVLAPALFDRVQAGVELGYGPEDRSTGFGLKQAVEALPTPGVMADIQAAIDWLAPEGPVGVMGFCWGGLLTWRAACQLRGLSAAVCYYGGGMTRGEDLVRAPTVPVLAHFATADEWIPLDSVQTFAQQHPDVEVRVYAGHHGFNCDQRPAHDWAAAALAQQRTQAFWAQHVDTPMPDKG